MGTGNIFLSKRIKKVRSAISAKYWSSWLWGYPVIAKTVVTKLEYNEQIDSVQYLSFIPYIEYTEH